MSATKRRKLHVNSLTAYHDGQAEFFSAREIMVLRAYRAGPMTDREVMIALRFTDMNAVRPRITELVDDGVLEETSTRNDPITRKPVRVCRLRRDPREHEAQATFNVNDLIAPLTIA